MDTNPIPKDGVAKIRRITGHRPNKLVSAVLKGSIRIWDVGELGKKNRDLENAAHKQTHENRGGLVQKREIYGETL